MSHDHILVFYRHEYEVILTNFFTRPEASYLSADALARSVEQIVTLTKGPNESVTSYVNRLRDSFNNLNRQVQNFPSD